jgi:hypothetical protein
LQIIGERTRTIKGMTIERRVKRIERRKRRRGSYVEEEKL